MTDRPIIFSQPMIAALLAGRKTQTRRLAMSPLRKAVSGDRLWVKERGYMSPRKLAWEHHAVDERRFNVQPQDPDGHPYKVYSSIHMPRWASRLTLIVSAVRFQRLWDVPEHDATSEGIVFDPVRGYHVPGAGHPNKDFPWLSRATAREMYAAFWDTLHGSGSWLGNPEVVALTFRVVRENIDRMDRC